MIQRIQSVYLFLAAIAIAVMFFFPIANFYSDTFYFYLGLDGISDDTFMTINTIPLVIIAIVLILLAVFSIFMYKNRLLQMRVIRFGVLLDLAFIIVIYFGYIDSISQKANVEVQYKTGIYFPLAVLVFLILAIRAIMADEKKVRAADRLR
ncbi:MAG: DUF4293 domain-containing protein [Bacteroidales bacterium]|jgi:hypothetical protein|nr:DUF4293 domain-containing protein [Bacteroidales bacterium]